LEEFADLVVDVADVGEVALAGAADVGVGDGQRLPVAGVHQALAVGVHVFVGDGGGRIEFGDAFVEVPVFAAGDEGVVRVGEAGGQAPRPGVCPA